MWSMQCNVAFWVPAQLLLWDQGKPRKTLIELAGHRTFLTSSQQFDIKYASRNITPYLRYYFIIKIVYKFVLQKCLCA
jgi:hypothetical protein